MLGLLVQVVAPRTTVILQAVSFAVAHTSWSMAFGQVAHSAVGEFQFDLAAQAFLSGVIFGMLVVELGSAWPTVVAHALTNVDPALRGGPSWLHLTGTVVEFIVIAGTIAVSITVLGVRPPVRRVVADRLHRVANTHGAASHQPARRLTSRADCQPARVAVEASRQPRRGPREAPHPNCPPRLLTCRRDIDGSMCRSAAVRTGGADGRFGYRSKFVGCVSWLHAVRGGGCLHRPRPVRCLDSDSVCTFGRRRVLRLIRAVCCSVWRALTS